MTITPNEIKLMFGAYVLIHLISMMLILALIEPITEKAVDSLSREHRFFELSDDLKGVSKLTAFVIKEMMKMVLKWATIVYLTVVVLLWVIDL